MTSPWCLSRSWYCRLSGLYRCFPPPRCVARPQPPTSGLLCAEAGGPAVGAGDPLALPGSTWGEARPAAPAAAQLARPAAGLGSWVPACKGAGAAAGELVSV
jgi:hypothetical protein